MKNMKHLKSRVHEEIQHLDGRVVENLRSVSTDEILGIIGPDENYAPEKRDGTLLDPDHDFWNDYLRDVYSRKQVEEEVTYALHLLRDEGKFTLHEPEGEEISGVYIDVASVEQEDKPFDIRVEKVNTNLALVVEYEGKEYEGILHKK